MFLNDQEDFLLTKNIVGLQTISYELERKLEVFLKLFVFLYADDTALLAESPEDLQSQLNAFKEYCEKWKMTVNASKTKVMVFVLGRTRNNLQFFYGDYQVEIVKEFNYLGIVFTKTCNFSMAKKHLGDKALRAMYELLKKGRLY